MEPVVDLYQAFGNPLVDWLESLQKSNVSNAQKLLASSALLLLRQRSDVAYPFMKLCTDSLKHLLKPEVFGESLDAIIRLGEKLSAIAIFLFHLSTAGSIRGTQAIRLKLFNEAFQSSMDLDSMRNVYIYKR